jgi:hypothetical protein
MSRSHQLTKALNRAESRDRKHKKRMQVTGTSVFALRSLMRTRNPKPKH